MNLVFDGNSLTAGTGVTVATMPQRVAVGLSTSATNLGVSGQTWRRMNGLDSGSAADVDAAWVSGRRNYLVCWETINSLSQGRTVSQTAQDCIDYIAARRTARLWDGIILVTSLPRGAAADNLFRQWNNLAIANYQAWGANAIVDVRALAPFNFDGGDGTTINSAAFVATQSYWFETSDWTHLNDAGYQVVADLIGNSIRVLAGVRS